MKTFCSYFNDRHCDSCSWISVDYAEQLARKESRLRDALSFLEPFTLEPSQASPVQGFRNRAKLAVTGSVDAPVVGLTGPPGDAQTSNLDDGRELLSCPIQHPKLNMLIAAMPDFIRLANLIPYQIATRQGELKGLIVFHSPVSDQSYLRFVLRSKECVSRIRKHLPALLARFPDLVCVSANIQPIPHAILEGHEEIILTEQTAIAHAMGSLNFKLTPQAFVQTNVSVATDLYKTAARWIGEAVPRRMLELYCGQGAFSFFSAEYAQTILGIELNPDAVKIANESAKEKGLTHLLFEAADAASVEKEAQDFCPDLILANPPRRGLGESAGMIERLEPSHFIYSSCSIETMAADLRHFARKYRLRKLRLFDMFPHTGHFETLAWLERATLPVDSPH